MEMLLCILLLLMLVGAITAIETTNLLSSVICVGAVGFLVSIAFLLLAAPDIAITQMVVEVLCLVILIRATISRDLKTVSGNRELFGLTVSVVLLVAVVLFGLRMFEHFPAFGASVPSRFADAPAAVYLRHVAAAKGPDSIFATQRTGAGNIVTSVLLDFRAYDTLGEATVLFCSILGALAILRKRARREQTGEREGEND